ncbi:hypothetical protein TEA_022847 [Camellia sinensis var. sinensis]|uniref:Kinetochore protein Spc24 n=1 Tax=Camellia sinensis var. sinensis TaxID=542762 RepID=A0A4S4D9G8_CAMSN|nr:hypothetical protein TEA_022847 [Camellia sinensis var. sinensis]
MGDLSKKTDVKSVIAFSDDLVGFLSDEKDVNNLTQHLEQSKALQSQCDVDYNDVLSLLRALRASFQVRFLWRASCLRAGAGGDCWPGFGSVSCSGRDYQKRIDVCNKKTNEARFEAASDAEMDLLQQELEEEFQRELVTNEISDLENQRASVEERREIPRKLEQDEMRAQMKLSMYASVTNIIPNQHENYKVSRHIVKRDRKAVEKFEFDPSEATAFDTYNDIWNMISL